MRNKILNNIFWILVNKILIYIIQFIIGIKIANYYGSEKLGVYTIAVSIISFSDIFFEMMNTNIIKIKIEEAKEKYDEIISLVSSFRTVISLSILIGIITIGKLFNVSKDIYYFLIILSINNLIYEPVRGIEIYFEYRLKAKNIAITNTVIRLLSCILQLICINLNFSIISIAVIKCIGSVIARLIIKNFYKQNLYFKFIFNKVVEIIKESLYLWISFVAIIVYSQIDKLMIARLINIKSTGVYSIALQLIIILGILINPIQSSLYSTMVENSKKESRYYEKYQIYNTLITWLYILFVFISIVLVKNLFKYIYSQEYNQAINIFIILSFGVIFKANSILQNTHIVIFKYTKYLLAKNILGMIINIILNYILILKYGIIGAAIATVLSQIITLFLIDLLIPNYRKHFFIQLKSFNVFNLKDIFKLK